MRLFIYGTLKTNKSRNFYLSDKHYANAHFVKASRTAPKYRLVKSWLLDYPCLLDDSRGIAVEGELWDVPEEKIPLIDAIEGHPNLFQRRLIELEDGEEAQAYFIREVPWFSWHIQAF